MEQVSVGVAVSIPMALAWYLVVDPLSRKVFFPLLAKTRLNQQLLLIRDTSQIPDVVHFEFVNANNFQEGKRK